MMPKTKLQDVFFTLLMAFVMVYGMVCYTIAIERGGMSNAIFWIAFKQCGISCRRAGILYCGKTGKDACVPLYDTAG